MPAEIPPPRFPPIERAPDDGLLMIGGHLSPEWLLAAYRQGIFPWPIVDGRREVLAWFSPNPRAIIELDNFHVSRRLARRIRREQFRVTINHNFQGVMQGCAAPRDSDAQTWITPRIIRAYCRLHELGYAHSVEVWHDEVLVGGVYGVAIGAFFAGESMFHRTRDASKVALAFLVRRLKHRGFCLFDVQQSSPHLTRLGATETPRSDFLQRLRASIDQPVRFDDVPCLRQEPT